MSKHTPGPWKVAGRTVYALNELGTNRFDAHVQSGWTSKESRTSLKELVANARLIAAAPELLEALQVAELALRERGLRACGEYKQIEAAIAKATGA